MKGHPSRMALDHVGHNDVVPPVPGRDALSDGGRLLGVRVKQGSRDLLARTRRLGTEAAGDAVVALGEVGVSNTTVAAALIAAMFGVQPDAVVGLGAEADTEMLDRKLLTRGRRVASCPGSLRRTRSSICWWS
jgi:hypothetical protein